VRAAFDRELHLEVGIISEFVRLTLLSLGGAAACFRAMNYKDILEKKNNVRDDGGIRGVETLGRRRRRG
jgi:hypothetical protein